MAARKARCIPDTATVWDRPTRCKELVNSSVRLSRFPVTRPRITGDTSSGKAASMPCFKYLDSTAGQYRSGIRSGRWSSSPP